VLTKPDLPMETGEDDIELKRIYLFAKYHGGGLARAMMTAAIEAATSMGKHRLLLGVYNENHRPIAFYRRMGFEICGERAFTVGGQTFNDWIMARAL
jgi:diamine N-acetyltransferase